MTAINVRMKNGESRYFPETSCPGGSYCTTISYEIGFAVIENAYGEKTAIPSEDISEVKIESPRRSF